MPFLDSQAFHWVVLPLLIFLARVCDVSISTVRIILLSKGSRFLAPVLGFFEILIWLLAVRQIFLNLANPLCFIAYAGGYAIGTYVGILIEERLAIGFEVIRVITKKDAIELIAHLQAKNYGVTSMRARGSTGDVHVIFTIVKRSDALKVLKIIERFNPKAFYTIEDIRSVQEGIFPRKRFIKQ
ncbi:MAG: hypothetical protein A3C36_06255 [Omnitrophica WOR_2 bacterium RIFCSPHIGHO2_02_FULL_52_10]|nr:MAG: hypothetical protein A3C36_06255 [Omnitrophica WOR_2 bacterium RIFCSPHIGHO2_02_FULL_52_10]